MTSELVKNHFSIGGITVQYLVDTDFTMDDLYMIAESVPSDFKIKPFHENKSRYISRPKMKASKTYKEMLEDNHNNY